MIWQTHPSFTDEFRAGGCAIMTCWWWSAVKTGLSLSPDLIAWHWKHVLRKSNAVKRDGTILDWKEAYRLMGLEVVYMQSRAPAEYVCRPGEWEHLHWVAPDAEHFTAGDGRGRVTYDPWGESETVQVGKVQDKRIFVRRR